MENHAVYLTNEGSVVLDIQTGPELKIILHDKEVSAEELMMALMTIKDKNDGKDV